MKRYLIAYENTDTYDYDPEERIAVIDNKQDAIDLLSSIISCPNDKIISIVEYDFLRHDSKILKPTLNNEFKLDLEEEK